MSRTAAPSIGSRSSVAAAEPQSPRLSPSRFGYDVPVLGQIPLDLALRESGDQGRAVVLETPDSSAAKQLISIADALVSAGRGLAGVQLGLSPAGR